MSEFQSRNYPIKEDMDFQRRSWTVERTGWLILGVIMVAALVGLFGYGPVSKAHLNGNDLKLSYERFQRSTKLATYVFRLGGGSAGERQLTLGPRFQTGYEITSIQPQPLQSTAGPDGLTLKFGATGDNQTVVIWAHPRAYGLVRISVASGNERHPIWSFVYP